MNEFVKALRSGRVLVMDGAMGTELQRLANVSGGGETLNVSHPDAVRLIQRAYLDAGAEVLLTNTFQLNPVALARRGMEESHQEIWRAAIELARGDDRPHFVIADIGPIEDLTSDIAATLLNASDRVDAVLLETWSSLDDLDLFAQIRSVPLLASFTYDRDRIEVGQVEAFARAAQQNGAVALGANCGKDIGMADMLEIVRRYRSVCDLPIFVRPNAGMPIRTEGGWRYPRTPIAMAAELRALLEAGIAMIGGCCGTTPEHIREFRRVVDGWNGRGSV